MHLRRIQASSIAEVVIAMSIIAICFGIASIVMIRSTMVMDNFQDIKLQSELQVLIWETMIENNDVSWPDDLDVIKIEGYEGFEIIQFHSTTGSIIWQQELIGNDN